MTDNRTEFKVITISKGMSMPNMFIVIMQEKDGKRLFPVLVDPKRIDTVKALLADEDSAASPLLKTFRDTFSDLGIILENCTVNGIIGHSFSAELDYNIDGSLVTSETDAVTAIMLALYFRCPIYILDKLAESVSGKTAGNSFSIPVHAMATVRLKDALKDAIEREDYSIASMIRDELKDRK